MTSCRALAAALCLLHAALAVKVKVVLHSEQEDSRLDEDEAAASTRADYWDRNKRADATLMPFLKRHRPDYDEERATTEKQHPVHPNDVLFPLIYRQSHINSMFKFGENWYTWSAEKRADGTKKINYYICYDAPKRCDDVGWERTGSVPRCAFQIESVAADDRACLNTFGVEPHAGQPCDGAEQMKVSELVRACGPRVRSLWRFVRAGRRPPAATKPADVNSLLCEDEEECFLNIEYRIHHDRITFSVHEPARGQTFKSVLKREPAPETTTAAEGRRGGRRGGKGGARGKGRGAEGKGLLKEQGDSRYSSGRFNNIKVREDLSDDLSE